MSPLSKISIVIPSYNKGKYLKTTLNSILNQKYDNLEVIIQDGSSSDESLKIIKSFAKKYPNKVKWESKKDKGQTDAINKGLKKATGEIVTYLNGDDVYKKDSLNLVGRYFNKNPNAMWIAGKCNVINGKGKEISSLTTNYKNTLLSLNSYKALLMVNYLSQPAIFIKKSAYKKYGPLVGTKSGVLEYDLWLKLGAVEMPSVINRNLASFRLTKGSISTKDYENILSEDYIIAQKYTKNSVLLFLHWLHNVGRVITLYLLKLN